MAIPLPGESAYSNVTTPRLDLNAGETFVDLDIEKIVNSQHYLMGRWSPVHACQNFGVLADPGAVTTASGSLVTLLTYIIVPRLDMTNGIEWRWYADAVAADGEIRVQCVETGTGTTSTVVSAGSPNYGTDTLALSRSDTVTTIEVQLRVTGAGTSTTLRSFGLWDTMLTVGTMP